jgi:hypothetical protein
MELTLAVPANVAKYLNSRGVKGPWIIKGPAREDFIGAVVIPSLAESGTVLATLRSLAANPPGILSRFLVLVVVNNRADAREKDKYDNYLTLERLAGGAFSDGPMCLAWVDAASEGLELPGKGGGVGLARKIGFDLSLSRLAYENTDPLLVALDADTLVRPDYLPAIVRHFQANPAKCAVIPFHHQPGSTPRHDKAIRRYELFLRCYVLGLTGAGSPYAFHTVGSAMACTAGAYVKAGGMNSRVAGEDFYFLQQLHRTSGVARLSGTVVYPSARDSHRVPFGTGRSVGRQLSDGDGAVLFYQPECFSILGRWLELAAADADEPGEVIHARSREISRHLHEYLDGLRFAEVWEKLRRNSADRAGLLRAFHDWFDGLKTMKLIHHLSDGPFPRFRAEEGVVGLFRWAGLGEPAGMEEQLALLREIQTDCNF